MDAEHRGDDFTLLNINNWKSTANQIETSLNNKNRSIMVFFSLLHFIHKNNWQGSCHATSAVLHILLSELGENSQLYIGECKRGEIAFDHSWIEIKGKVFDAAISNALEKSKSFPPVFSGIDLDTGAISITEYGITTGCGYDQHARIIKQMAFGIYMDGFPNYKNGLWGVVEEVGSDVSMNLCINQLREKYMLTLWNERK